MKSESGFSLTMASQPLRKKCDNVTRILFSSPLWKGRFWNVDFQDNFCASAQKTRLSHRSPLSTAALVQSVPGIAVVGACRGQKSAKCPPSLNFATELRDTLQLLLYRRQTCAHVIHIQCNAMCLPFLQSWFGKPHTGRHTHTNTR